MQTQKAKKKAFDPTKSRVKLVVYDQMNVQKSFYSFLRDDRKGYEHTINAMKKRILADHYRNNFKNATFYNTHTDSLLLRVSQDTVARTITNSKVKLVVYDSANAKHTFYSNVDEDKQDNDFIIGSMHQRILHFKMCGKYNSAIFYAFSTDEEIARYSSYGRITKQV